MSRGANSVAIHKEGNLAYIQLTLSRKAQFCAPLPSWLQVRLHGYLQGHPEVSQSDTAVPQLRHCRRKTMAPRGRGCLFSICMQAVQAVQRNLRVLLHVGRCGALCTAPFRKGLAVSASTLFLAHLKSISGLYSSRSLFCLLFLPSLPHSREGNHSTHLTRFYSFCSFLFFFSFLPSRILLHLHSRVS